MRKPVLHRDRESGVALLSAILVLMLMSALLVGFMAMVNSDQTASGINRDQTQAYAAAHAGVEKLTADLGQLFQTNFAPTNGQVDALTLAAQQPTLPGINYTAPNGGTGYRITYTDVVGPNGLPPADGRPDLENQAGSPITAGPYQGLVGLITPYNIEVTARTSGGAEVRMRRTMQTVGIPVFQFGIFSENDLSFFAGPNFAFGGRVHTNQHLFLKQDGTATLTLQDRVTAVGEIIRTHLANGLNGTHPGNVRMALASGCPAAPTVANASCRNLADTEGSLVDTLGSAQNEPTWTNLSMGTYNGWIRNGRTGARRLDLPVVSDGARTVDLIRRPPAAPVEDPASAVGRQRFFNMATIRVLLSDSPGEITALNTPANNVPGTPIPLQGTLQILPAEQTAFTLPQTGVGPHHPFATAPQTTTIGEVNTNLSYGFRVSGGTPLVGGYILISRQDRNGTWTDVTKEVLNLGFAGKRLSAPGSQWGPNLNNDCVAPHRNAIIRVQRYREINPATGVQPSCAAAAASMNNLDYLPNVLYDPREGMLRDAQTGRPTAPAGIPNITNGWYRMYWSGVMHYVELDVNNLRRWLNGDFGGSNAAACQNGGGPLTCPMDVTGFVFYMSDRRGNKGPGGDGAIQVAPTAQNAEVAIPNVSPASTWIRYGDDAETGELGFEDIINTDANSRPNNALDHAFVDAAGNNRFSEDLNWEPPTVPAANAPGRGTVETYGGVARLFQVAPAAGPWPAFRMLRVTAAGMEPAGLPTAGLTGSGANYLLVGSTGFAAADNHPIDRNTARVNPAFFFRRALKVINGGRGELPSNGSQGLTIVAENPIYVEGNFNACFNNINQATGISTANQGNNFEPGPGGVACTAANGFGNVPGSAAAGGDHVSAAVIGDAVTLLSNRWNDLESFQTPAHIGDQPGGVLPTARVPPSMEREASTTWYRLGIISGKGLNFPRAATTPGGNDNNDWGTDGGAHNFLRYIEDWGGETLNYRGSILSFYMNRQAVGIYKCCDTVYSPPARGYNFDQEFLTPALLPPRTPMFRDLNTLTFRQVLRPTQ
jgi:hypothetical protein